MKSEAITAVCVGGCQDGKLHTVKDGEPRFRVAAQQALPDSFSYSDEPAAELEAEVAALRAQIVGARELLV